MCIHEGQEELNVFQSVEPKDTYHSNEQGLDCGREAGGSFGVGGVRFIRLRYYDDVSDWGILHIQRFGRSFLLSSQPGGGKKKNSDQKSH